jgi:hypothetical protein
MFAEQAASGQAVKMVKKPVQRAETDPDLAQVVTGHGPCTYLLLALLGLILVYPYLTGGIASRVVLGLLYAAVLLGGAFAIERSPRLFVFGLGLGALGIAAQWTYLATELRLAGLAAAFVYVLFLLLTIGEVLRYILTKGPITADKLHGALAAYLMIAFLWAFIYILIENIAPGSFTLGGRPVGADPQKTFLHLLYFSFTTLTTTGYGDIIPVSDQARSIVIIEQFTGVFYVGVLIARLAGLYPPTQR